MLLNNDSCRDLVKEMAAAISLLNILDFVEMLLYDGLRTRILSFAFVLYIGDTPWCLSNISIHFLSGKKLLGCYRSIGEDLS